MVEWKNIGEICYISDYVSNGSFASLRENVQYKNEPDYAILVRVADYSCGFDASKFVYIDEHAYNFLAKSSLDGGEIIMSNVGSCGLLFRCPKLDRKMSLAPNAILIKSDYIDFLYYWLGSNTGQEEIKKITSKSAMPKFNKTEFKKINIPIPSLEEQTRIVGILDTFTSSIENLKQQIAERRKQYEYYRDQLLDLEGKEGVEMKTLPEISKNCDRARKPITSSKRVAGIYPYYGASGIVDYVESYIFDGDYLLISEDGANLVMRTTPIAFSISGKNWVNNHAHVLKFNDLVTQKYVEIYLNMINLDPWINGAAQPKLNQDNLNRIEIPLPSLEEQSRIVSILDTFEASISNLEAQLKEREKQYEYYRNKLLTFE